MDRSLRGPRAGGFPSRPTRTTENRDADSSYSSSRSYNQDQRRTGADDSRNAYSSRPGDRLARLGAGSTNNSSGSSLLDRMRMASADTSANDEPEPRSWASRKPTINRGQSYEEEAPVNDPNSAGNTIWGRVVNAAGSLTLNVSKAWENGISLQDGRETPPGEETRLTKAMKAYYIERARTPSELPSWLFEESERQSTMSRTASPPVAKGPRNNMPITRRRGSDDSQVDQYSRSPPRGALRDIYDSAAKPPSTRTPPSAYASDNSAARPSKAASRLQAMRDAKRLKGLGGGSAAASGDEDDEYGGYGSGRRAGAQSDTGIQPSARRAGGLPSRPNGGAIRR